MKAIPALLLTTVVASSHVEAAVNLTFGAGSAVTSPDHVATFDSVVYGTPLQSYVEDSVNIWVNDIAWVYSNPWPTIDENFHYPNAGANGATMISLVSGADIYALEVAVASGFDHLTTHLRWEAFDDGLSVGLGALSIPGGSIIGFDAPAGFDQLYLGAYSALVDAQNATIASYQAIVLDNLLIETDEPNPVPEVHTYASALGAALVGISALRRRQAR